MTNAERKRKQTKTINDKAKQKGRRHNNNHQRREKIAANKPQYSALAADFTMKPLK